jgi:prephenate dehydratase
MMLRVAFQGEIGAHSELAIREHFGTALTVPCREFAGTVAALRAGAAHYAALPLENSLVGAVPGVAELLADEAIEITTEFWFPVHHCLLAVHDAPTSALRSVLSHPVALAQCTALFVRQPELTPLSWYDTAGAAKHVAHTGSRALAAIASQAAAERYGLRIVERNVEDRADNRTRFVMVRLRAG